MLKHRTVFTTLVLAACLAGAVPAAAQYDYTTAVTLAYNDSITQAMALGHDQYWWKTTIPDDGQLVLTTRWATSPVTEIFIYDWNLNQLARSTASESFSTLTLTTAGKGTYFIRVVRKSGEGTCSLISRFTPTSLPNDAENNDIPEKALVIGAGDSGTGHIGYTTAEKYDQIDWWKTSFTIEGLLTATVATEASLDADLILYDENQVEITRVTSSNSRAVISMALFAGTYYFKIMARGGQGSYTISTKVTTDPIPSEQEPNNQTSLSIAVNTGATYLGHLGYYGKTGKDQDDYFSFTLPNRWDSLFVRSESSTTLNAVLTLYDSGGLLIGAGRTTGTTGLLAKTYVGTNSGATKYFLQIHCDGGYGTYAFIISSTAGVTVKQPVAPPSNLKAAEIPNDNGHTLSLTWNLSPDDLYITEYRVFRSRSNTLTPEIDLSTFTTLADLIAAEKNTTILIAKLPKGTSSYIDPFVPVNGVPYYYWIQAVGLSGVSSLKIAANAPTAVRERGITAFKVFPPSPNPFNPSTTIRYDIPESGRVNLRVYDALGRTVAVLEDRVLAAGTHGTVWNGRDSRGVTVASGMYLFRLQAGAHVHSGKLMFIR